ncbi:hypothetical protein W97_02982 [Coniosporium apollinis CBS 100218]|uniref:Acylphosphatase-like domain-containing protein n=1 Tax=Coniosporium apollinis (strain CBS 100218) TaxID=1168221 RepID=R7YPL2_CONA1|nr:uncharacterized protein W97_02982 [Coniosporium apollinis CBS 100218]EON63754.1 hypothetical protein W97_02982 [Coniosporium apollinis CBS 100218]
MCKASTSGNSHHYTPHTPTNNPRSSFTVKQANKVGVTGYVKNASDGSVQGEAQGEESSLKQFVEHLNKGPSAADVNKVETSDIEPKQGESGFSQ